MSYAYQKRSTDELECIAEVILSRYAIRCSGCFVDIEAIAEDCNLTILLRRGGLNNLCEGYIAENPHYIIIPEAYASYQPRYRTILSEEFSHAILEYNLLAADGKLPPDAKPHTLTKQQHDDVEQDTHYLCLALILPKKVFIERFNKYFRDAPVEMTANRDKHLTYCAEKMELDFEVWSLKIAYRMRDLKLITDAECRSYFSNRIKF